MLQDDAREPRGMSGADFLSVGRSYWVGILLLTLISTGGALGWYILQPKVYAAESSGIVVTAGTENLSMSLAGDNLAKSKAKGYKSVGESILVAESVVKALGLGESAQAVAGTVSVDVPLDSAEIRVTAQSSDPQKAQKVADAWVIALAAQVYALDKGNAALGMEPASKIVPLAKASVPSSPVSPKLNITLGVGAAGGLLLGFTYALVRNHLDRRIRAAGEIERLFRLAVVGTLPLDKRLNLTSRVLDDGSEATPNRGGHAMGEALRELRTNLNFIDVDNPPRILLITSSLPSEGKSTVVGNLAATIAAAGEDVIVVDADLRRPTVHQVFGVLPDVGVTDVLTGRATIDDVLQEWGPSSHLKILSSGRIPPNPSELLGSRAMEHLLRDLSQRAIVLVDTPPLLPVTDAAVLSSVADGTLVVARARKTTTDNLQRALKNLGRVRGRVLGVILNCVATKGQVDYSYGYYGAYGSKKDQRKSKKGQRDYVPPMTNPIRIINSRPPSSGAAPSSPAESRANTAVPDESRSPLPESSQVTEHTAHTASSAALQPRPASRYSGDGPNSRQPTREGLRGRRSAL